MKPIIALSRTTLCLALLLQTDAFLRAADTLTIRPAVELHFSTDSTRGYQLQTSGDLAHWTDVENAILGNTGDVQKLFPASDATANFYRLETFSVRNLNTVLDPIRTQYKVPALACAVVLSNRVVGLGVVGVRKFGVTEPATLNDKWHHGSLTKSMTATLAGLFVDEAKLTWTTKLVDVFPEYAANMHADWKTVSLEQLLSHRSGSSDEKYE